MLKQILCLMFLQLAVVQPSRAGQVEDFFREQFKHDDVIYLGEFHTVAEHKVLLGRLLQTLMMDDTVDAFAFEFSRSGSQPALDEYLRDSKATPGSEAETNYFKKLNWSYDNMFNVSEYDAIMRLMKQIWISKKGAVTFCAIDARGVNPDTQDDGPKYKVLKALPQAIQNELVKISGKSIELLARNDYAYERESTIGANVASCASRSKKTIAYVGLGHAVRTERIVATSDWRTAARYTEVALRGKSVKSALIAQGYFDPYDPQTKSFPVFSEKCLSADLVTDFAGFAAGSTPREFDACLVVASPDGKGSVSYAKAFDYIVAGPKGSKIKPSSVRQWR